MTSQKTEEVKKEEKKEEKKGEHKETRKMPKALIYAIVAIAVVVIVIVAYVTVVGAQGPVVQTGDNVSVYYTGTFTNGTIFGTNVGSAPFNFTVGSGDLIPGFTQGVIGMKLNQTKTVTIPANEAYGEVNPNLIMNVPRAAFGNQSIRTGEEIASNSSGTVRDGIITSVNATNVIIDFNPPLAGDTLVFTIRVVSIRNG